MKTVQFTLALFFTGMILISPVMAQDALQSRWHNSQEISFPTSFQYDEKNELHYLISNDADNLYIQLVMVSEASQIRALRYGLTVYVDAEGKGNKQSFIKFLPPQPAGRENAQNRQDPSNPRVGRIDQRKQMVSMVNEVEISGFRNKKPFKSNISELSGFSSQIKLDEQSKLSYEISIPLDKVTDGKGGGPLSIGVESGFINTEEMMAGRQGMQNRPQGQRPEGQRSQGQRPEGQRPEGQRTEGQRPQGMRPGGTERPVATRSPEEVAQRRQEMQKLTVPIKVWVKTVALAKK